VTTCVTDQDSPFLTVLLPLKDRQVRDGIRCFSGASKWPIHRNCHGAHEGHGRRETTEDEWER
jgi:hypothetical protein